MGILMKLTLRTMKQNKKRTAVTIVGIILATAMMTAVANLGVSFRESMVVYERVASGDFHYSFTGVEPEDLKIFYNNENLEKVGVSSEKGYALLEGSINPDKPYLYLISADETAMGALRVSLQEGRMPEKDGELLLAAHVKSNGGVVYEVGDMLTLSTGYRESANGEVLTQYDSYSYEAETLQQVETKEYTVVGIISRISTLSEPWTAPGYTCVTYGESEEAEELTVYATYKRSALRQREKVTAALLGVSEDLYNRYYNQGEDISEEEYAQIIGVSDHVNCNVWLIKWELLSFSNRTMNMIIMAGAMAIFIIVVASVFCIRNSFQISLTEKIRMYGMLSSVGLTTRQRKRLVYDEALVMGAIGIPLGAASGVGATAVLARVAGRLMEEGLGIGLVYAFSWPILLIGFLTALLTIFFSARKAAKEAGKISPISAIRMSSEVKVSEKEVRMPGFVKKGFGVGGAIAWKNLRRARRKYRTTVVSIVVSVAVFISMTFFLDMVFYAGASYGSGLQYDIEVSINSRSMEEGYETALRIAEMEGIEKVEVARSVYLSTEDIKVSELWNRVRGDDGESVMWFRIMSIGEKAFAEYLERLGVTGDSENQAILLGNLVGVVDGRQVQGLAYDCEEGQQVTLSEDDNTEVTLTIARQATEYPLSVYKDRVDTIIVSDVVMDQMENANGDIDVYIDAEDPGALEKEILKEDMVSTLINMEQEHRREQALYLLIAIFMYGFITVIALIGVTNIFNTITTNLELRSREFAMLRSIGMTGREFNRMVRLECIFYGGKALLIGIPLGVLLSYGFYQAFIQRLEVDFALPLKGILIATAAVFVLVFAIMHYEMAKINRKNIIETIQNENI